MQVTVPSKAELPDTERNRGDSDLLSCLFPLPLAEPRAWEQRGSEKGLVLEDTPRSASSDHILQECE